MSRAIAQRYAQALFDLAEERRCLKKVLQDMELLHEGMQQSADLRVFVHNPVLSKQKQETVLKAVFGTTVDKLTMTFLIFVSQKGRLAFLGTIAEAFQTLYRQDQNVVQAEITAPEKLTPVQIGHIEKHFKTRLNKEVVSHVTVDPDMLGGMRIQIEDRIFDFSLDDQLAQFKRAVLTR